MRYTFFIIACCFALISFAQPDFNQQKFKLINIKDSINFDLDIEFDTKYPYSMSRCNLEADSSTLLSQERKRKHHYVYGKYKIKQDSIFDIYIVLMTSREIEGGKPVGNHCNAQISMFVYDKFNGLFKDTLVLAQKSMWVNAMDSGDMIYLSHYKSTVYFDPDGRLVEIRTRYNKSQLHSVYAVGLEIEKEFSLLEYVWQNGFVQKL